jgi:hypothetical protein
MAHRKVAKQMPNPTDILMGKVEKINIKEISAMYSLTISLCYELQTADQKQAKNWDKMADNFFKFLMENFPTELTVMGAKVALTNYNLPFDASKLQHFDKFHTKYGKYIIQAMESA